MPDRTPKPYQAPGPPPRWSCRVDASPSTAVGLCRVKRCTWRTVALDPDAARVQHATHYRLTHTSRRSLA